MVEDDLKTKEISSELLFVCWTDNAQCKIDDGHVATLGVFTVLTNTLPHVYQTHGSEHGQHQATQHRKITLLEPRVAQL